MTLADVFIIECRQCYDNSRHWYDSFLGQSRSRCRFRPNFGVKLSVLPLSELKEPDMRYKLAEDAKPQVWLLLIATVVAVALWFIPYGSYVVYPIRLFVTFIHESSHALIAVLTGGSVQSLTIAVDGSGLTYSGRQD